ncbi:MAG: TrkH family potassium uptake protein [Pseudomonadales bacterium]|nr:TrkH family potassium uptake protein [Pseudomonadales bacterium]
MINRKATLFLTTFPIALMGFSQLFFGLLSFALFHDHQEFAFLEPATLMLIGATFCLLISKNHDMSRINFRDSLLFSTLTWTICGLFGAAPIILIAHVSLTDGVFESVSALTTTGATVLTGLDDLPKSFLLYRQFLQWIGGLGVVVFVVAILPMLNVGGMKLLKAETPGPVKDQKLSPRVSHAAHYLWIIYLCLSLLCALAYKFAGMSTFDAIAHSLSTVSTGGFSTHDASMGYFHNPLLLMVSDIFMLSGAISFVIHFKTFRSRHLATFWKNEETRVFLLIILVLTIGITTLLLRSHTYEDIPYALNVSLFHLISFITSTGFGANDLSHWPTATVFILVFASYLGGCSGSTAGGNKIIRMIIATKLIGLELKRLLHPNGVFLVKYENRTVEPDIMSATIAFLAIVAFFSCLFTVALMMTGLDFWSSFTAVAACLNVLGPAFGELGSNFQPVSDAGTWLLSVAMILGRLEYFTVLALFLPAFWRHY